MARDNDGYTPLHCAAEHGNEDVVKALVTQHNCPVDCVDSNGWTPLVAAAQRGHASTAKMLISELGANMEARDKHSQTALHHAVLNGHKNVVHVLIHELGSNPGVKGPGNQTSLHAACHEGQLDMVNVLIDEYKCDVMARDNDGCTPFHTAAACGREDVVKALIMKYNCPVDCVDSNGRTALMAAAQRGHASTVKMLISELGANMEARDKHNQTALHYAAGNGHKNVVHVLIHELGSNPGVKGPGNQTPLHVACQEGLLDMVNVLINEYKCDVMVRRDDGLTPLHIAASYGREDVVKALIMEHNCPVDCVNSDGLTPLMLASAHGHAGTVKILASELGASVETRDKDSKTSLHYAAFHGHKALVSLLIEEFGCSPHSKEPANYSPLHAACQGDQVDIVNKLIEKYNCDPMARDDTGCNSLHIAVLNCEEGVVKELVVKHGCSVNSICSDGNTPTHLATYTGRVGVVKLLTDVFGAFPSIKNNLGNTPMDCNTIITLLSPQISTCFSYLHQCGIRQRRTPPHKVLLLGENSQRMADLINAHSTYSLPQSHLKENACFLNYVNEEVQDIWMCQYSGKDAYRSMLLQTLMSGTSYTAICIVDLDKKTDLVVDEIHSQVSLIKEVIANTRDVRTDIIICGISSVKQSHQSNMNSIHEQAKSMISGSTRIDVAESITICFPTTSPEKELKRITSLIKSLENSHKYIGPKMRYGSVYLLKLLLKDFSDVPCVTFTQLDKHLQDKRISTNDTHEDIWVFLEELNTLHFIVILGDKSKPKTVMIIINPLVIVDILNSQCIISSDPLVQMGIVTQTFLSTSISAPATITTILSLLKRFGLPSIKFPLQRITSDVALRNTSDTFFFMPHIVTHTRQSMKWFISCDNPFTIGFSLEVLEGSDPFSLELQYFLLFETAHHFIGLLNYNGEFKTHVHNAVFQGGTIWALDDVEILTEVYGSGRSIIIMAKSPSHHGLKCINLVSQIGNIVVELIHQHCSHVSYKTNIFNPDFMRMDIIPLATKVPKVEASSVLWAITNDQEYVQDSEGAVLERQKLNWLQRFTLKGECFLV